MGRKAENSKEQLALILDLEREYSMNTMKKTMCYGTLFILFHFILAS